MSRTVSIVGVLAILTISLPARAEDSIVMTFHSDPEGATLYVGGENKGYTPTRLNVTANVTLEL